MLQLPLLKKISKSNYFDFGQQSLTERFFKDVYHGCEEGLEYWGGGGGGQGLEYWGGQGLEYWGGGKV